MTKIGLIAAMSCLAFAGAASAQSLYGFNYRATETTPWAGPYAGIHGGYALDEDNTAYLARQGPAMPGAAQGARPPELIRDKDGYAAGVQSGWNVQAGRVVLGIEGDFSITDFSSRNGVTGLNGARSNILSRNNYLGSERGRFGFVMPGGVLLYGTGGYATTEVKDKALLTNPQGQTAFYGSHEYKPQGWVAGAGVEYAIPAAFLARYGSVFANSKITTGVEWLHYDFSAKDINVGAVLVGAVGGYVTRFDNYADVVRARINYKF